MATSERIEWATIGILVANGMEPQIARDWARSAVAIEIAGEVLAEIEGPEDEYAITQAAQAVAHWVLISGVHVPQCAHM